MDLSRLSVVLLSAISLETVLCNLVPHEDHLQEPAVYRNCIEVWCRCGTEPRICELENTKAECIPCDEGEFQAEVISSRTIAAKQCKAHRTCSGGLCPSMGLSSKSAKCFAVFTEIFLRFS